MQRRCKEQENQIIKKEKIKRYNIYHIFKMAQSKTTQFYIRPKFTKS